MAGKFKEVKIGKVKIGGENPIAVQSMLSVPSYDVGGNIEQAIKLKNAGCEIIRVAIPDMSSLKLITAIKNKIDTPLVADIHFNYKLAVEAANAGIDKIRINPGNIGDESNIKSVVDACKKFSIPIRIGVNSGSIEKHLLAKYGKVTPEAMVESAMYNVGLLEKYDFNDIVISMKSSDVLTSIEAYKLATTKSSYPLHLGVTEAGTYDIGIVKSSIAIGSLLLDGIGSTIRVTLTDDPIKEVYAGFNILKALHLRKFGITFISCPTCGRTRIDLIKIVNEVQNRLKNCKKNLKIAIMGCAVNGPGEAKEADIGIAGGNGFGIIFKKGRIVNKVRECDLVNELVKEVENMSEK